MPRSRRSPICVALAAWLVAIVVVGIGGRADALTFNSANFAAGTQPFWVTTGDFNGDGIADLAVANFNSGTVTVHLGDGTGGFQPPSAISLGVSEPDFITATDLNADGKLDLAVADQFGSVDILLGDGNGGFAPAPGSPHSAGVGPRSIAVADYNGDGRPDLAVANFNGPDVSILLASGGGNFGPATSVPVGGSPISVATADLNGDGKADLVTANFNQSTVSVLLGDGTGGFTPATSSPIDVGASSFPSGVLAKDLNGDGIPDIAVARGAFSDIDVLLNNGAALFTSSGGFATGGPGFEIASADFNGDGRPDLATGDGGAGNTGASVLLNVGGGAFTAATGSPYATGSTSTGLAAADFDRNGTTDLAVANQIDNDFTVLLNTSQQVLTPSTPSDFGNQNVGTIGAAQTIDVDGGSGLATHITRITMAGGNPDDFLLTQDHCTDATLGDGYPSTCSFGLRFAPTAAGARSATVQIFSNGPFSPTEVAVTGTGGPSDTTPPTTTITGPTRTRDRTPTFTFTFSENVSSVRCKIDGGAFFPCGDRYTTQKLSFGPHTIYVQATDDAGNVESPPASKGFTIKRR